MKTFDKRTLRNNTHRNEFCRKHTPTGNQRLASTQQQKTHRRGAAYTNRKCHNTENAEAGSGKKEGHNCKKKLNRNHFSAALTAMKTQGHQRQSANSHTREGKRGLRRQTDWNGKCPACRRKRPTSVKTATAWGLKYGRQVQI